MAKLTARQEEAIRILMGELGRTREYATRRIKDW